MSDLDQSRWWSERRLPGGEVELTVKLSWFDAGWRTWGITFVAFAVSGLAFLNDRPVPAFAVVSWFLGVGLVVYAWLRSGNQVWWLKPEMAVRRPGQRGEAAYFVTEVRLEHLVRSNGRRRSSLRLVTPAEEVEVSHPDQGAERLAALGRAMAKALEVGFSESMR